MGIQAIQVALTSVAVGVLRVDRTGSLQIASVHHQRCMLANLGAIVFADPAGFVTPHSYLV
jgi:hypothetical protein